MARPNTGRTKSTGSWASTLPRPHRYEPSVRRNTKRENRASARLIELLDSGAIDLTEVRCSCTQRAIDKGTCNRGRRCGRLTVNGKDVGDTLIAEGLAVPYHCRATKCPPQQTWC